MKSDMADDIILFPSLLSTISLVFILFITYLINEKIRKKLLISQYRATLIFFWHNLFVVFYVIYSFIFITDAKVYYIRALQQENKFDYGSVGIDYIVSFLDKFHISYLGMFFIFGFFGCLGVLFFDSSIKIITKNSSKQIKTLSSFLVFLPSMHFWTSAIGKDSIAFLAVNLAILSSLNFFKKTLIFYLSALLMFFVRPHISVLFLISFVIYQIFNKKTYHYKGITFLIFNILLLIYLVPIGLNYAGIMNIENVWSLASYSFLYDNVIEFIKIRQNVNLTGGSSIIIEDKNTLYQMFTYLYRPHLFEFHNLKSFYASIDNIILFLFTFISLFFIFNNKIKGPSYIFLISLFISNLFILSKTTANLGIAVRQKWMIVPILIILLLSLYNKKNKNE